MSHTLTPLPLLADASQPPSGDHATEPLYQPGSGNTRSHAPESRSQMRTVKSIPAEARRPLPGCQPTVHTELVWPRRALTSSVSTRHK